MTEYRLRPAGVEECLRLAAAAARHAAATEGWLAGWLVVDQDDPNCVLTVSELTSRVESELARAAIPAHRLTSLRSARHVEADEQPAWYGPRHSIESFTSRPTRVLVLTFGVDAAEVPRYEAWGDRFERRTAGLPGVVAIGRQVALDDQTRFLTFAKLGEEALPHEMHDALIGDPPPVALLDLRRYAGWIGSRPDRGTSPAPVDCAFPVELAARIGSGPGSGSTPLDRVDGRGPSST